MILVLVMSLPRMGMLFRRCFFTAILVSAILEFHVSGLTDHSDAHALRVMYRAMDRPPQLKEWKSESGDPCDESWTGVSCFDSSVIRIDLHGLDLTGYLDSQISSLQSLKQLDLSSNHFYGEIPSSLPLNITHLNLASNNFSESIPNSLSFLKHLEHLNISNNALSGILGDFFGGLENLREMDLSHNNFTGDLPISFRSLRPLTRLYLQGNDFTGSVAFLADLPLSVLNIEDNHFSGVIPENFQFIKELRIGGNRFDRVANYPPWPFPSDIQPNEQNISSPPTTELSEIERYPPPHKENSKRRMGGAKIASLVIGIGLVAAFAAIFAMHRIHRSQIRSLGESPQRSFGPFAISTGRGHPSSAGFHESSFQSSMGGIEPLHLPPIQTRTVKGGRRSFSKKCKIPISAKLYSLAELQLATNNFSMENLLGEGSLGSVYRAEFNDGQIFSVKNISTVQMSLNEEEQFLDVIRIASRLRHPNIVTLVGYCVEHDQHLLVYEYIRSLSLENALHCVEFTPLSWGLRLRISLGVARALNYLHSSCIPPIAHSNLKAGNVLLDEDFRPRICDCGLAVLRPLTNNSIKLKASEMAISDRGYVAPENVGDESDNLKADIFAFGVLLLELLTGRRPYDSLKEPDEKYLARWASSRLHEREFLMHMVDPGITRMISSKDISRCADIISLCIQPEKEFRPAMSEIVDALILLVPKPGTMDGNDTENMERSFRSSNSNLYGSPTLSYFSI